MRLRIFGRNSDDKGTQLEGLVRRLLVRLGYKHVSLNVVGSGGSEIDIRAEFPVPGPVTTADLTVIGECKAYETPVALPDWLKFLGKVYSEEVRWPGQVRGLFVALSGANGNVRGAADEFRRHKNTVDLVDGENLISLIQQEFGVPHLENVVAHLQNLTSDLVTEFSIGYYEQRAFWIVQFAGGSFTVLLGGSFTEVVSPAVIKMVQDQLQATSYRDLYKEEEYRRRLKTTRKLVLGRLITQSGTIERTKLILPEGDFVPSESEFNAAIDSLVEALLVVSNENGIALANIMGDDRVRIEVFRELTDKTMFVSVVCSAGWLKLVDDRLLGAILRIQGNLPLPPELYAECLSLLRWSPTALAWAVRPDVMLVQPQKEPAHHKLVDANTIRYFRIQLLRHAVNDFNNGAFTRVHFEDLDLREVEFSRHAKFKSSTKVELEVALKERHATARAAPDLGGGLVKIWVHDEAPEPWDWGKKEPENAPVDSVGE